MRERNNIILKFIDKQLGPVLLILLGAFSRRRKYDVPSPDDLKVLVIKTGAFGDALLVGSAVSLIKKQKPKSKVTFICTFSNVQAVRGLGGVDQIYVFDLKRPWSSFAKLKALGRFDLVLDFAPWARLNGLISFFAAARYKVGFKTNGMHRHYVYDAVVEHSSSIHELDNYRNLLAAAGIRGGMPHPSFSPDPAGVAPVAEEDLQGTVVLHPFPGGALRRLKEWPEENWVALGKKIVGTGRRIMITGGCDDAEAADRLAARIGDQALSRAGSYNLNQTAWAIMKSGRLVTVDTGVMHLGSAVGAKVVSLHGPTSPERWGANGPGANAIYHSFPCSPCISLGFESKCRDPKCMQEIKVDEVFSSLFDR